MRTFTMLGSVADWRWQLAFAETLMQNIVYHSAMATRRTPRTYRHEGLAVYSPRCAKLASSR